MKSLFAIAVLHAIPKQLTNLLPDNIPIPDIEPGRIISAEYPGIGGKSFTIKLHKSWFRNGDVIKMDSMSDREYLYLTDGEKARLEEIHDKGPYPVIDVEFFKNTKEDRLEAKDIEKKALKVCSVVVEPRAEVITDQRYDALYNMNFKLREPVIINP